jgi:GTP-binding protein
VMVYVLVDGEIGPTALDVQMLDWLRTNDLPHQVVATKLDKVRPSRLEGRRQQLSKGCGLDPGDVLWVSAAKGTGVDKLGSSLLSVLA